MVRFEWDENKNQSNLIQHGIDFQTAQLIFDDPGCVTKRPGALCAMPDGTGGLCSIVRCTGDRPCLHCKSGPVNSPEGNAYYLLIIVGMVVSVGGLLLVLRLRKYWK